MKSFFFHVKIFIFRENCLFLVVWLVRKITNFSTSLSSLKISPKCLTISIKYLLQIKYRIEYHKFYLDKCNNKIHLNIFIITHAIHINSANTHAMKIFTKVVGLLLSLSTFVRWLHFLCSSRAH